MMLNINLNKELHLLSHIYLLTVNAKFWMNVIAAELKIQKLSIIPKGWQFRTTNQVIFVIFAHKNGLNKS